LDGGQELPGVRQPGHIDGGVLGRPFDCMKLGRGDRLHHDQAGGALAGLPQSVQGRG
jgi:hypothetical protein